MEKERLTAFTDAVLAIIMTILVLELEKPEVLSWQGFWALGLNYFAYALSFFWIGLLWYNHHNAFAMIRTVNKACVYSGPSLYCFSCRSFRTRQVSWPRIFPIRARRFFTRSSCLGKCCPTWR